MISNSNIIVADPEGKILYATSDGRFYDYTDITIPENNTSIMQTIMVSWRR